MSKIRNEVWTKVRVVASEDEFREYYAPSEYLAAGICKRDTHRHRKLWWAEICPFQTHMQ